MSVVRYLLWPKAAIPYLLTAGPFLLEFTQHLSLGIYFFMRYKADIYNSIKYFDFKVLRLHSSP
jgi:hypothetical protein